MMALDACWWTKMERLSWNKRNMIADEGDQQPMMPLAALLKAVKTSKCRYLRKCILYAPDGTV